MPNAPSAASSENCQSSAKFLWIRELLLPINIKFAKIAVLLNQLLTKETFYMWLKNARWAFWEYRFCCPRWRTINQFHHLTHHVVLHRPQDQTSVLHPRSPSLSTVHPEALHTDPRTPTVTPRCSFAVFTGAQKVYPVLRSNLHSSKIKQDIERCLTSSRITSVEDQASAARLVLKQAHASWRQAQGSGSILSTKHWSRSLETIQRFIPSNLIQITTGHEPNCCLSYAGTRKENSSRN